MYRFMILILSVAGIAAGRKCNWHYPSPVLCGLVNLMPDNADDANVTGELILVQNTYDGPVRITGTIYGLSEGLHGFHVHTKGDLRNGCSSAGTHFNPENVSHGAPNSPSRHVGDLGNIRAGSNGIAEVDIIDDDISLHGVNNIFGRTIIVHSNEDDLGQGQSSLSRVHGNAGSRLACGMISILLA